MLNLAEALKYRQPAKSREPQALVEALRSTMATIPHEAPVFSVSTEDGDPIIRPAERRGTCQATSNLLERTHCRRSSDRFAEEPVQMSCFAALELR